jgi:predicted GIY-YIG superfamily endonuclease
MLHRQMTKSPKRTVAKKKGRKPRARHVRTRKQSGSREVYVLKLANGRYYVGQSANIKQRIRQHTEGKGSAWTKKFPVKAVLKRYKVKGDGQKAERQVTLAMMKKHGIDNVRGGKWTKRALSAQDKAEVAKALGTAGAMKKGGK